jgi:N-acetylglutamate synthase-like GNAT family acetyltransferase
MEVRWATEADVQQIVALVNLAFRVESFMVYGDRTTAHQISEMFQTGTFLLAEISSQLVGCLYLELRGERAYFGLLAVDPVRQHRGLGRRLIDEAENYARASGCRAMDLRIVNLRAELPPFYRRLGYVETGTEPFPAEIRSKLACHFVLMSKALA